MTDVKSFWDFSTGAPFQWIALLVGVLGAAFGVISWLEGRRKDRVYKYLFAAVDKNIDKSLTDDQIIANKSEATRTAAQIEELRKRIETEIPLEARRTVLKDRIDANVVTLQTTLASTLEMKEQLSGLGRSADIPEGLLRAVESEILPEYVATARRETLKTYLIIIMAISVLISAVIHSDVALVVQMPLLVIGASILTRLLKASASKMNRAADSGSLNVARAALFAAALTAGSFAFTILYRRWPHRRYETMPDIPGPESFALVALTSAIGLFVFCAWLIRTKRQRFWRVLAAFAAILAIALALLSLLALQNVNHVGELAAGYVFALVAVIAVTFMFYFPSRKRTAHLRQ
jgi:hypothetical protein